MYTQRWFSSILILAFLFLASCTSRGESTRPSVPQVPTVTSVPPSSTPLPTHTLTPSLKPSPTPFFWNYSPNSEWEIWIVRPDDDDCGGKLILQNSEDQNLRWELSEQGKVGDNVIGLIVLTFHWSVDGKYLYLVSTWGCSDYLLPVYLGFVSVKRLDLISGEIIQVLPSDDTMTEVIAEISSDSRYLAYLDGYKLTIRDLGTWEERSVTTDSPILESDEDIFSTGGIKWSPDNTNLIYGVLTGNRHNGRPDLSLIFVDTINMTSKLLMEDVVQGPPVSIEWLDNEEIRVEAWLWKERTIITLIINTTTGEITEVEN